MTEMGISEEDLVRAVLSITFDVRECHFQMLGEVCEVLFLRTLYTKCINLRNKWEVVNVGPHVTFFKHIKQFRYFLFGVYSRDCRTDFILVLFTPIQHQFHTKLKSNFTNPPPPKTGRRNDIGGYINCRPH